MAHVAKLANMAKTVNATDAKNNFGGLLDDVAALGRVDVMKHGRVVAVVLSPRAFSTQSAVVAHADAWSRTHMIPPELARAARIIRYPDDLGDE
jgi:prevent-host-death family protein